MLTGERWRAGGDLRLATIRVGTVAAWPGAAAISGLASYRYIGGGGIGDDSNAYWLAGRVAHPYTLGGPGSGGGFLYSPLFAQAMRLLAWMPWPVFCTLWMVACAAVYWWLTKPLPWRWRVPALLICWTELMAGNVYALLAFALVVSVSRPAALAFPTLTKLTPGGIGFIWHACQGDWRAVGRGVVVTFALAVASFLAQPHLWVEWFRFLAHNSGNGDATLWPRVATALALAVVAGRRRSPTLLVIAYWLAMPMGGFLQVQPMAVLVAAARLRTSGPGGSSSRCSSAAPAYDARSQTHPRPDHHPPPAWPSSGAEADVAFAPKSAGSRPRLRP